MEGGKEEEEPAATTTAVGGGVMTAVGVVVEQDHFETSFSLFFSVLLIRLPSLSPSLRGAAVALGA